MIVIALMGVSFSGKSTIEKVLEKLGFKRSISYSSSKINTHGHKDEVNGVDYNFVTREQFMSLVDKGIIIEYEENYGNLYGTPRLFGSTSYVAVVCVGGFKALKELYGNQVLGVYLRVDKDTLEERTKIRDNEFKNTDDYKKRAEKDKELLEIMEKEADIIIDASDNINNTVANILEAVKCIKENTGDK